MTSNSVQDYLQTIYRLQSDESPVSTTVLAGQLGVTPASASGMMRKLHADGLVEHVPYRGAVLTKTGELEALRMLRHHRLWERFLTDVLGLGWDEVHEEAHRLEHATSERVADRLAEVLNNPATDPHGQPIPAGNGTSPPRSDLSLAGVERGQAVQIAEVPDSDPDRLRYLGQLGLYPGTEVTVLGEAVPGGPLKVRVGGVEHTLDQNLALQLLVVQLPREKE
jgi:DtxR family Mn-dependent transcriptional regulator